MISLATILVAVQDIALAGVLVIVVWLARKDYPYRAVRWLARKARGEFAAPSAAHPAARAVRGQERISDEEAREFEGLERQYWDVPAVADSERPAPRGEAS